MAKHVSMQRMAIEQLVIAFEKGGLNDSHVEWEDLEIAYQYAISAMAPRALAALRKELEKRG